MVSGLGIILIFIAIIRHIGACIKENNDNNYSKQQSISNGNTVWYDHKACQRSVVNNHLMQSIRNDKYGLIRKDKQTGQIYYEAVDKLLVQFRAEGKRPNSADNMWRGQLRPSGSIVYIDCDTERLYILSCAHIGNDVHFQRPNYKTDTWIYVDFWDGKTVIKKTGKQLEKEEMIKAEGKEDEIYTLEELNNFEDRLYYDLNRYSSSFERKNGMSWNKYGEWKSYSYEK